MKTTQVKKLFLWTTCFFCGLWIVLTLGCGGGGDRGSSNTGGGDSSIPVATVEPTDSTESEQTPPPKPKPETKEEPDGGTTTVPAFLPATLKTEVEEKWAAATSVAEKTTVIAEAMENRLAGMNTILLTMTAKPEELSKNTKTLNTLETELRHLCQWSQKYSASLPQKDQVSARRRASLKIAGALSGVETAATWSGAQRLGQEVRSIESRMFQPPENVMAAVKDFITVAAPPRQSPSDSDSDYSDDYSDSDSDDSSSDSYYDSGTPIKAKSISEAVTETLPLLLANETEEAKLIATLRMLSASGKQLLTQRNGGRMVIDPRTGSMDNSDSSDYDSSEDMYSSDNSYDSSSGMDGGGSRSSQRERLSLDREDTTVTSSAVTSNTGSSRQQGSGNGNTAQRTGRGAVPTAAMGPVPPAVQLLMLGTLRQALTIGLKQVTENKASTEELRIAAMEAYCLLADEDILPTMAAYVQKKDTTSAAVKTCFTAMMTVPEYRSDPRAIGIVMDFLDKDARVVTASLQMAAPIAATLIAPKIKSNDKVVRNGALLVIADSGDATSILNLLPILESSDADLRQFVLESLAEKGDIRAAKAMAMRLMNSGDRAAATNALIRIGSPSESVVIGMFGAKQPPQIQAGIDLVCLKILGDIGSVHSLHPLGAILERYGRPPADADMTGIDKNAMVLSTLGAAQKIMARSSAAMGQFAAAGLAANLGNYPRMDSSDEGEYGDGSYNSDGTAATRSVVRPRSLDTTSPPGDKPIRWMNSVCKVAAVRCQEATEILRRATTQPAAETAAERMKELMPQLNALKAALPEARKARDMAVSLFSTEERRTFKPLLDETQTAEESVRLHSNRFQTEVKRVSGVQPLGTVLSGHEASTTGASFTGSSDE